MALGTMALGTSGAAASPDPPARAANPERGKHGGYLLEPEYYGNFIANTYRFLASPFQWKARHWATAAAITAGIGAMLFLDEPIRDFWQEDVRSGTTDDIASVGEFVGEFYSLLPAAGAGFAAGAAFGDRNLQATALEAIQALAITAGFVKALKYGTHRHRPADSPDDAFNFDGPGAEDDNKSFVSGHAAYSFAAASTVASAYEDSAIVPVVAYGLAGLSAWSRVNDDKHWTTDVVVGGALGIIVGKLVHHTSPFRRQTDGRLAVRPLRRRGANGLQISLKF